MTADWQATEKAKSMSKWLDGNCGHSEHWPDKLIEKGMRHWKGCASPGLEGSRT